MLIREFHTLLQNRLRPVNLYRIEALFSDLNIPKPVPPSHPPSSPKQWRRPSDLALQIQRIARVARRPMPTARKHQTSSLLLQIATVRVLIPDVIRIKPSHFRATIHMRVAEEVDLCRCLHSHDYVISALPRPLSSRAEAPVWRMEVLLLDQDGAGDCDDGGDDDDNDGDLRDDGGGGGYEEAVA